VTQAIEAVFATDGSPDAILEALMPVMCAEMDCDRCVFFPRNPATGKWAMTHGWQVRPEYALKSPMHAWSLPAEDEGEVDPMYAQAMKSLEVFYVSDVFEEAGDVVNAQFGIDTYGNRALAHAPIYHEGRYYGLIEPCTAERPHPWTDEQRRLVARTLELLGPVVAAYVAEFGE